MLVDPLSPHFYMFFFLPDTLKIWNILQTPAEVSEYHGLSLEDVLSFDL